MKLPAKITALSVSILALGASRAAQAHAFLDHADPKVGSQIAAAPAQVSIWFTEDVEEALSTVQVFDAAGKQVDKKDCRRDPQDAKRLLLSLPDKLPDGTYKVVWKVVASDTHTTQGDFTFTVKSGK